MKYDENNGIIPTYKLRDELDNLSINPNKPSARIFKSKIYRDTLVLLDKIEKDSNHSWYAEILNRAQNHMDKTALFYRGTKISYSQMFEKANLLVKSFANMGLQKGDIISCCLSNTPELVYIMLAANKLGLILNLFGTNIDSEYLYDTLRKTSNKLFICTDNNYAKIKDVVNKINYDKKLIVSLADSLPANPELCDEYEPELKEYYYYDNLVENIKKEDDSVCSFEELLSYGNDCEKVIIDDNELETIFTITYTSGSTRKGFPKQIVHCNRSYIVGGIFNATNLTGSPEVPEIRGLAHIHSDSNTSLITCISDNLIKGGSVALEPEYGKKKFLDYLILNHPVHCDATTSYFIEAAKEYLIEKRFHKDGKGKKIRSLLCAMAVGEKKDPGEEKFINVFLRKVRAGSDIKLNGVKLLFAPMSEGGIDCEHGGILYTLLSKLQELKIPFKNFKGKYGLIPVPFAVVTALKMDSDGNYEECDYNEEGIIVANSMTSMKCYKDAKEKTKSKIITDKYGRDWLSCDCWGYINSLGNVVVHGRIEDAIKISDDKCLPLYRVDEIICRDTKNILSCSSVKCCDNGSEMIIANIEISPLSKKPVPSTLLSIEKRLKKVFPSYIYDLILFRVIDGKNSYPLNSSGKRDIPALQSMGFSNTFRLSNGSILSYSPELQKKEKTLTLR